jgi:hypothetical protein
VCIDFIILEVKVPIIFFRHVGFSATQGWTLIFDLLRPALDLAALLLWPVHDQENGDSFCKVRHYLNDWLLSLELFFPLIIQLEGSR